MTIDNQDHLFGRAELEIARSDSAPATLELDVERYRSDLDSFDLTDAQATELLQTLWSIMRSFVELGFDVDICAQMLQALDCDSGTEPADIDWAFRTGRT